MKSPTKAFLLTALLSSSFCAHAIAKDGGPQTRTQATMQRLFRELTEVFRISLDATEFQDPENRDRVLESLYALAANAGRLDTHAKDLSPGLEHMRRSLVRDANEAVMRYRQGQYEGSRFLLDQLVDDCFGCHASLPAARRFEVGKDFLAESEIEQLAPEDRVRIEVATRQFDVALDTYENMLESPALPIDRLSASGVFEDYLKICLRVHDDYDRAVSGLQRFLERDDVPRRLAVRVEIWIGDLEELKRASGRESEPPLDRARTLIRDAQYRTQFPNDPQGLVRFVAASAYLNRYLAGKTENPKRRAEAFYLLGVAESFISRSYWVSESDYLLEQAIRTAPGTVYARMAYNFLEEYITTGYTGSSGIHIPPEIEQRLEGLRALVEKSP